MEHVPRDLKQKIELVKCIMARCQEQTQQNITFNSLYNTVMFYTSESTKSVMQALASKNRIDFKEWSSKNENYSTEEVLVNDIHDILYTYYVKNRDLMLLSDVAKSLVENSGIVKDCESILKSKGFIWRNVPNTSKCLLIEDPVQQARRIEYLLKIAQYKEEKRSFVYVEGKQLHTYTASKKNSKKDNFEHLLLAASPHMGLLDVCFLNPVSTIDKWLEDEVYPHLNSNTVLIYEEDPIDFSIVPPQPESTKKEMIEWLVRNKVAHHAEMRRAELYKLTQIFCKNEKICPRDEILKAKGIVVLRRPRDWPALNYFNAMWRRVDLLNLWIINPTMCTKKCGKKRLVKDQFLSTINMFTVNDDWQQFHNHLTVEENRIFEKDMELEEVIDKLLTMAKHEDLSEIPLPETKDVKDVFAKYDCIITDRWKGDNDDEILEVFLDE